jgi:uncharacterized protein YbjT (DUF2867 family)
MYAIVGATGNTGRLIADRLLTEGKPVRVIGRNAEKLQSLVAKGAGPFVGSVLDASFLERAFAGVTAIYAMTPPSPQEPDFRAYQNRVGEAIVTAVREAGVRHVVQLSSMGADRATCTGPVLGLRDLEQRLDRLSDVHILHLRPTYFMENLLGSIPGLRQMGVLGGPLQPDVVFPMIATRDIAMHAAERLLSLDFSGHDVQELLGERDITMQEVTPILGRAIGKPDLQYVRFPYADVEKGMIAMMGLSPDVARSYVELGRAINDGMLSGVVRSARNTTPTTIEQFAPVFAAIYRQAQSAPAVRAA